MQINSLTKVSLKCPYAVCGYMNSSPVAYIIYNRMYNFTGSNVFILEVVQDSLCFTTTPGKLPQVVAVDIGILDFVLGRKVLRDQVVWRNGHTKAIEVGSYYCWFHKTGRVQCESIK